eukprot:Clim_evm72s147 gene=Clim_evmTU72s147
MAKLGLEEPTTPPTVSKIPFKKVTSEIFHDHIHEPLAPQGQATQLLEAALVCTKHIDDSLELANFVGFDAEAAKGPLGKDKQEITENDFYDRQRAQFEVTGAKDKLIALDHALKLNQSAITASSRDADKAMELYDDSLKFFPTAEAYVGKAEICTQRGDEVDKAISQCLMGLAIDKEYGPAYNLIASCHLNAGREDEAIEWFEMAKRAARTKQRHFPYLQLGNIYALKRRRLDRALREYLGALSLQPDNEQMQRYVGDIAVAVRDLQKAHSNRQ